MLKTSSFRKRLFEGNAPAEESRVRSVPRGANNGIRRRHAAPRTGVYTQVYTGVENSGLLGPHASKPPQPETVLTKRICPALFTWDLLSPQPTKLFANDLCFCSTIQSDTSSLHPRFSMKALKIEICSLPILVTPLENFFIGASPRHPFKGSNN